MPTSKELLEMANLEWQNREERKGIHDRVSWTSGWISGYLTRNPQAERELFKIDENDPALKAAKAYMAKCHEKFQRENPCPKCGHNTDIDVFTPMFCRDCGYEWLPELREGKGGEPE